jgi:trigger factor
VVEVKPAIALGEYRGVEVQHAPAPVTDADVDEALGRMREQHAQFRSVERAAATDDLVVVDYTLAPQDHEPTTAAGYHFLVGSGTVLPEIDGAVVGMRAGEEREVSLRFADDHRMETLRGKSGTAHLKVGEVKEKVLPALDDEFAKTLGEFETLDALGAEVRRQLEARRETDARQELEDKIMDALLARHEFGVPDVMVMRQVAHQVEHTRERLRRQGVDPDGIQWDYTKIVGELRPAAEKAVRRALLLEAIADQETLAASDAEVDAEVERFARASQRPVPAVRRMMEKSGDLEALRHGLRDRKTLDLLIEHARVTA